MSEGNNCSIGVSTNGGNRWRCYRLPHLCRPSARQTGDHILVCCCLPYCFCRCSKMVGAASASLHQLAPIHVRSGGSGGNFVVICFANFINLGRQPAGLRTLAEYPRQLSIAAVGAGHLAWLARAWPTTTNDFGLRQSFSSRRFSGWQTSITAHAHR